MLSEQIHITDSLLDDLCKENKTQGEKRISLFTVKEVESVKVIKV